MLLDFLGFFIEYPSWFTDVEPKDRIIFLEVIHVVSTVWLMASVLLLRFCGGSIHFKG
jgi:hypothetical protein